ncbi:MAG: metacaspase [Verrucomicrobiota bacterium]
MLAIAGGSLTLLTSILTNYFTASANREADERRALYTRETDSRALQSELIKTFLKTQDSKTARDNLTFLIESGLIPDHEKRITEYLAKNKQAIPKITEAKTPTASVPPLPPLNLGPTGTSRVDGNSLGVSLHLGTSRLDPNAYGGWDGALQGAVPDANAMQGLAGSLGYQTNIFVDTLARRDYLLSALGTLSATLRSGDTLLLTMSGHGAQVPDLTGAEPDKRQETWVLFDREILASELYGQFASFKTGVIIIVVQDSAFPAVFRRPPKMPELSAQLIVLAGSKENQMAADGIQHGKFTETLLAVWDNGKFSGNYTSFVQAIQKKMPEDQVPQLYVYGPDTSAASRKPFALAPAR